MNNQPNQDEELEKILCIFEVDKDTGREAGRKEAFEVAISSIKQWAEKECKICNDLRNNPNFGDKCKHDGDKTSGSDCSIICNKCGEKLLSARR